MEERPTYAEVVSRLAPCGLDCERCVMCATGRVKTLATELADALRGFESMASRVADRLPSLREYSHFAEILGFFARVDCQGCRSGGPQLPFCAARTCYREQGVDFCFQCGEYPCERNAYPEAMAKRWLSMNDRMREVGVEEFYKESLARPRY